MLLGKGNYDDRLFINAVNKRIREAGEEKPSNFRLNLQARVWLGSNESNARAGNPPLSITLSA